MESLIPQILFLGPTIAPVLLRLGAAVAYALLASHLYQHRAEIVAGPFPIVGRGNALIVLFGIISTSALALAFAVGAWTQVAAIVGLVGALKGLAFSKKFPGVYLWDRMTYFLLGLMCLMLAMTGAGAFAIDLPY